MSWEFDIDRRQRERRIKVTKQNSDTFILIFSFLGKGYRFPASYQKIKKILSDISIDSRCKNLFKPFIENIDTVLIKALNKMKKSYMLVYIHSKKGEYIVEPNALNWEIENISLFTEEEIEQIQFVSKKFKDQMPLNF